MQNCFCQSSVDLLYGLAKHYLDTVAVLQTERRLKQKVGQKIWYYLQQLAYPTLQICGDSRHRSLSFPRKPAKAPEARRRRAPETRRRHALIFAFPKPPPAPWPPPAAPMRKTPPPEANPRPINPQSRRRRAKKATTARRRLAEWLQGGSGQ